jgi:hypothetical protein
LLFLLYVIEVLFENLNFGEIGIDPRIESLILTMLVLGRILSRILFRPLFGMPNFVIVFAYGFLTLFILFFSKNLYLGFLFSKFELLIFLII